MNNIEEQDDELIALASIYEDSFTSVPRSDSGEECVQGGGGELTIDLDLPQNFNILTKTSCNNEELEKHYPVAHLPPIYLHFTYPMEYPSDKPPNFTLSCKWLNRYQLSKLCRQLDCIWKENEGSVIMFHWAQYLKDNSLSDLNICDYLDMSKIKLKRTTSLSTAESSVSDSLEDKEAKLDSRTIQDIAASTNMLRLLIDYDEEFRKKVFDCKTFECKVCFVEKSGSNCLQFWPCHHVYCKECMKSYFLVQIKEGNIKFLRCPEEKCESEANPKQVQDLVPKDVYDKWDEMLLNSTLSSMGDVQPCPRSHCQYPTTIEDGQGQCPNCNFVFCSLCRFGYHGVEPCRMKASEAKEIIKQYSEGDKTVKDRLESRFGKKYLKKLEEEFLSMNYLTENSKNCPRCRTKIEKIDGCNKMTCVRCSNYFCWICMKMLDKAFPYDHFNNPKSACFEKLFLGVEDDSDEEILEDIDWQFYF